MKSTIDVTAEHLNVTAEDVLALYEATTAEPSTLDFLRHAYETGECVDVTDMTRERRLAVILGNPSATGGSSND